MLDEPPVLDAVEPRLPAGTKELATVTAHLTDSVVAAIEAGSAPATALDQPGLRALAGRNGSPEAVRLARGIVGRLLPCAVADRHGGHRLRRCAGAPAPMVPTSADPGIADLTSAAGGGPPGQDRSNRLGGPGLPRLREGERSASAPERCTPWCQSTPPHEHSARVTSKARSATVRKRSLATLGA